MTGQELLDLWLSIPAKWADGLTESEIQLAEGVWGFRFSPDYRMLISERLPIGCRQSGQSGASQFPDWRDPFGSSLVSAMAWPWLSLALDVGKYDQFWLPEWGEKPEDIRDRLAVARSCYEEAPVLVPVYGHRYLPALPQKSLPVLSVYQTDIIYYGSSLWEYLQAEFHGHELDYSRISICADLGLWTAIIDAD